MIGEQPTGRIGGVTVNAGKPHEPVTIDANGRPARLAIVDDEGRVVAEGDEVTREMIAVAVNRYRRFLLDNGFLRGWAAPREDQAA